MTILRITQHSAVGTIFCAPFARLQNTPSFASDPPSSFRCPAAMDKHMCVKAAACPPSDLMSLHVVSLVAWQCAAGLRRFASQRYSCPIGTADRCRMRCQFAKNNTAGAPLFCCHSLGCFGGTATAGEQKRTPSTSSGKQIGVRDVHLEMVPFLFSVPGQYSKAGIKKGTTPERRDI